MAIKIARVIGVLNKLKYIYPQHILLTIYNSLIKPHFIYGLSGESLKYANHILSVLLSICFTCMFKHCYLPIGMLNSIIVPLEKNKNGDLSDRNNSRPIALSSTVSKVFENVIINRLEEYLWTSDNQFEYKSGHSTD